ncbi:MAG: dihydropteroate synthase [Pseudomonadota bacterium]
MTQTNALSKLPTSARVYLQPTGWCVPDYAHKSDWVEVAGLPCWASAVRVIARDYGDRVYDAVSPVREVAAGLDALDRPEVADAWERICAGRTPWDLAGMALNFSQPRLMGIINATPDSFSDGGDHFAPTDAVTAAQQMVAAGADILDIGGESTRPGATTVWEGDEIERVVPVLQGSNGLGTALSLDTRKAGVMEAGLRAGAHIINDVSALTYDAESLKVIAANDCPVILMHAQGEPQTMQHAPAYDDVVLDVYDALEERINACLSAGIERHRIAIDPGIGFGKTLQHNLSLINNLAVLHGLGCPILLGVSRKRFIGALADVEDAKERMPGSLAAALAGLDQGVHMLRVHDVPETRQMLNVWRGLRDAAQMPPA